MEVVRHEICVLAKLNRPEIDRLRPEDMWPYRSTTAWRCLTLLQSGFLQRLKPLVDQPHVRDLTQRGVSAHLSAWRMAPRRIPVPRGARSYREYNTCLSDFAVYPDLAVRAFLFWSWALLDARLFAIAQALSVRKVAGRLSSGGQ